MRYALMSLLLWLSIVPLFSQQRASTAQANVQVLEDAVIIPELNRKRTLRIYLPPGYENSDKRYPVLYMHDAQNLFDAATSFVGEWQADEHLNALAESEGLELIVVGIDNGQGKRNSELTPWENEHIKPAEGEEYAKFVVEVVKRYTDVNYRTRPEREHTAIMGSSLGGLMSHYLVFTYPEVFSKAGIFSPSYWVSGWSFALAKENPLPKDTRLYMVVGKKEGPSMYSNMEDMYDHILKNGHPKANISAVTNEEGEHNEAFWSSEFSGAIKWLFDKK